MTRLRVARIITRLNIGGPAIQAMLLTERLDPARYESLLVSGSPGAHEGNMAELRPSPGVTPIIVPDLRREISALHDPVAFVRITRILRDFQPHIVHTHMAKAGLLGRLAGRLVGTRVILHTFHGNVLRGYFGPARGRLFLLLERALARMSTRVVAVSARQVAELLELGIGDSERIVRIPLGLDLAPFLDPPRGAIRAELGIDEETPIVGTVARLVPIKGVDLFIDAASIVHSERPDAIFIVVGDGELRATLKDRVTAAGLTDHVRFLGWRADLPAIYRDIDVLAMTARNEGTPVSVIEALAAGCAVVATAVGGVPDIVQDGRTGVLVRPGDASDVARRIIELLGDPDKRRDLGQTGRAAVFPEHDSATLVSRIDALYRSLAGR